MFRNKKSDISNTNIFVMKSDKKSDPKQKEVTIISEESFFKGNVTMNELHQQTTETQAFIRKELALHTSPAVISGRLRLKHGVYVSKNTLYRYIKRDRLAGGKL